MPPTALDLSHTSLLLDDTRDAESLPLSDPRFGLISVDPGRHSGTPCFAGTRVPVHDLFDYLAGGESLANFLESFPSVSEDQARRVLQMAEARFLSEPIAP